MNRLSCLPARLRLKVPCLCVVCVGATLLAPSYFLPGRFVRAQDINVRADDPTAQEVPVGRTADQGTSGWDAGVPQIPSSSTDSSSSTDGGTSFIVPVDSGERSPESDQADTLPPRPEGAAPTAAPPVALIGSGAQRSSATAIGHYGLGVDFGLSGPLPDAGLLLALRPFRWVQVRAGAGYNWLAFGVRGGVTLVNPVAVPLSLTCEGGHYFEGDANKVVHWFGSNVQEVGSLRRFSYDYLNLLAGLEFGERDFSVYIRGGVSWMRTTIKDFAQSAQDVAQVDMQASDPKVSYRGPTLKLGTQYFF